MASEGERGAHPRDERELGPAAVPVLREATADLSWLLGRGYSEGAAARLVGDRFQLTARQRHAVARCACSEATARDRSARRVERVDGATVHVDGFNVLITVERALSGGPVLRGRDGAVRDLAGVHGSWRARAPTAEAIALLGRHLRAAAAVAWWLDRPVSNSGRLAAMLREAADEAGWPWSVEVVAAPDPALAVAEGIVATSDGWILDRCAAWYSLDGAVLAEAVPGAWVVDLG
jgi:hypothetical protein